MPMFVQGYLVYSSLAKIASGKLDEGRAILDGLLPTLPPDAASSANIITMAVAYGHLNLALGKPEALFAGLDERVRPFREAGFITLLADEHWLRGRAKMAMGYYDAAREALLEARAAAEAQEERAVLWQILVSSAEVEEAYGDAEAAGKLCDQARAVVADIAEHAGELRETFLARPDVVSLLD